MPSGLISCSVQKSENSSTCPRQMQVFKLSRVSLRSPVELGRVWRSLLGHREFLAERNKIALCRLRRNGDWKA